VGGLTLVELPAHAAAVLLVVQVLEAFLPLVLLWRLQSLRALPASPLEPAQRVLKTLPCSGCAAQGKDLAVERSIVPVIFTVGRFDPALGTPPFAFGITNRVDEWP